MGVGGVEGWAFVTVLLGNRVDMLVKPLLV